MSPPRYLVGRAVPFRSPSVVVWERGVGAYTETFDRGSVRVELGGAHPVPLLLEHQGHEPIGRLVKWWETVDGLYVEARLAGSDTALAHVGDLVAEQVLTGLSVGFVADEHADLWTRGANGLPKVTRRNATLVEASLTWRPAYRDALVEGVDEHSTDHERSVRALVDVREWRWRDERRRARRGILTAVG